MLAIVREEARLAGGGIDEDQVGCVDVFFVVRMRDDDDEGFSVWRDLWVGDAENLAHPCEIEDFARSGGDGQP